MTHLEFGKNVILAELRESSSEVKYIQDSTAVRIVTSSFLWAYILLWNAV